MLHSSLRLFTVRGVPVGVNWTWLLVLVLVVWSLAAAVFPTEYPGHSDATYFLMAVVASALFFGSILVHELSHTLQSLREGIKVREVTLWLFGGVSSSEEPMPTPGAEFRVIAAGPAASAVLAVTFWIGGPARAIRRLAEHRGGSRELSRSHQPAPLGVQPGAGPSARRRAPAARLAVAALG